MEPIVVIEDNTKGIHYPHYDALVARAIVGLNGLKRMLIDNESSINILFSSIYNKMLVDHELTP